MSGTDNIWTETVVPWVGVVVSCCVYSSPTYTMYKVFRTKDVDNLNADPFVMMMANGILWIMYGALVQNIYVALANVLAPALCFGYYTVALAVSDKMDARFHLRALVIALICTVIVTVVAMVAAFAPAPRDTLNVVVGYVATTIAIIGFASPLSQVFTVIKKRDSAMIDPYLTAGITINSALWVVYGLAIGEAFLWVPNCLMQLSCYVQIIVKLLFHRGQHCRLFNWKEPTTNGSTPMTNISTVEKKKEGDDVEADVGNI